MKIYLYIILLIRNTPILNGQEPILDWYNAKILISFKLTKLNGNNIAANDNNGILNGAHSFVKNQFNINGREVYDCDEANHCVHIKNLIDYTPSYAESVGTNEFYFLDTEKSPNRNKYLTRQVQHRRNDQNSGLSGWTPRVFIENENLTFIEGFANRKKDTSKFNHCLLYYPTKQIFVLSVQITCCQMQDLN